MSGKTCFRITLDPLGGSVDYDCIRQAVAIAMVCGTEVQFLHNSRVFVCFPDGTYMANGNRASVAPMNNARDEALDRLVGELNRVAQYLTEEVRRK